MVACGQLGAYFEYELSPWDFAAGRLSTAFMDRFAAQPARKPDLAQAG